MIGFTGTRDGMTEAQRFSTQRVLERCVVKFGPLVGHGDCLGADDEFDRIAADLGCVRHIFPANIESMRAHCELRGAIEITHPMPPLRRNVWFVDRSVVLIGCPKEYREAVRSGTWFTIRRGRERSGKIPILVILPDGSLLP